MAEKSPFSKDNKTIPSAMCSCFAVLTIGEKTENLKINNGFAGNQDDSLEEKFGFYPLILCFQNIFVLITSLKILLLEL